MEFLRKCCCTDDGNLPNAPIEAVAALPHAKESYSPPHAQMPSAAAPTSFPERLGSPREAEDKDITKNAEAVAEPAEDTEPIVVAKAKEFQYQLDASIDFDDSGKSLVVINVAASGTDCPLQHGDKIVECDGITDVRGIAAKLAEGKAVQCKVSRPEQHVVILDRSKGSTGRIGCVIAQWGGQSLVVREIKDGLVMQWNNSFPNRQVFVGDRIVAVNGASKSAGDLLAVIGDSKVTQLKMVVSRE